MTVNPRQSFKLKLCLWIFSVSGLIFLAVFAASFYFSYLELRDGVSATVTAKLDYAKRALDEGLTCTEVSSDNLQQVIKSPLFKLEGKTVYDCCSYMLQANPRVQGIAIGFEPGAVKGYKGGFAPYVMRRNDSLIVRNLAEFKDYRNDAWYSTTAESGASNWSLPFVESNGTLITSYNVPLRNADGEIIGVTALDLNLDVISDSLKVLKPYPDSYFAIIDETGRFVAHDDIGLVMNCSATPELMASLKSGEEYFEDKTGAQSLYVFHELEPKTGWTILLYVPRSDIGRSTARMLNVLFIVLAIGIILLLAVSLFVISRLTKPLETFSEAARQISHGHFHVDLPVIQDHNELYDLRQALSSMEVSLDEYVHQLEETTSTKASMERDLTIARSIQMSMVPKVFPPYPEKPNIDLYASLTPAQAVGGDLYNHVLIGDTLFFCIGDVSGKGVPASLLMAITNALFRNIASEDTTPGKLAMLLNEAIARNNELTMFVTMFIGSFNTRTGEFKVCNCGHNPPATNGEFSDVSTMTVAPSSKYHLMSSLPVNIALGVLPGFKFQDVTMHVKPGTTLFLYTDGITEAENKRKELYSEERMLKVLNSLGMDADAQTTIEAVVDDVHKFVALAPQSDDLTCICIRC